ncbi:Alpha/beta hydrolase [Pseudooceanicola batsensis HTCC2597]|uniref:Alpha/beta hydrolase n=1 Tax=Pseudooceanicola batsensis (strain ATCC BAA-863 / DSM 15984 / KCTC 12145 / HTCC2597) TaxID=252305 RepID=A3U134_PSEBH|nr:alpha/beta fold hydrolase [Pseudooceanicola batsensis]EAQ02017.1 Alpha/beta hydrolase [Pseudooceanicola batsensis HTCC2597]
MIENAEHKVDIDGTELRMQRGGEGTQVLFLHGAAGHQGWLPFADALAKDHDVIATEHPGFGLSDGYSWADSIAKLADFYVKFLGTEGIGPVHLIGSSLGGWLASEIAVRDESLLRSLTLISPAGIYTPQLDLPDMLSMSYEELMRAVFASSAVADMVLSQPLTPEQMDMRARNGKAVARLGARGFYNPDFPEQLSSITVPTTIIWGDTDRIVPTGYGPLWKAAIAHSTLHVLDDCGHLPHIECQAAVLDILATRLPD